MGWFWWDFLRFLSCFGGFSKPEFLTLSPGLFWRGFSKLGLVLGIFLSWIGEDFLRLLARFGEDFLNLDWFWWNFHSFLNLGGFGGIFTALF